MSDPASKPAAEQNSDLYWMGLVDRERHAALKRLAASLSHALGTPLNVIAGHAELIEADADELPDIMQSAQSIREQAYRMSELVRGALLGLDALALNSSGNKVEHSGGSGAMELDTQDPSLGAVEAEAWALIQGVLKAWPGRARLQLSSERLKFKAPAWLGCHIQALSEFLFTEFPSSWLELQLRELPELGEAELEVAFSEEVELPELRVALEPWFHPRYWTHASAPGGVNPTRRWRLESLVKLAVALGYARDAGAEIKFLGENVAGGAGVSSSKLSVRWALL